MRKNIMALEAISNEDELIEVSDVNNENEIVQTEEVIIDGDEKQIDDLSDTIGETDDIITALESIKTIIVKQGCLERHDAKIINTAIEHFCKRMDYAKTILPALEAFGGTMTKVQATQIAIEGIKEVVKTAWEAIKKTFSTILGWITDFFKKLFNISKSIFNGLVSTLDDVNEFMSEVLGKKPRVSTEDNSSNEYDIDKPLTMHSGSFGAYLGNNKKDILTYIHDLKDIDLSILSVIRHSSGNLDIDIGSTTSNFKHPFTLEQKEFFKDKIPFTTTEAKVVPLSFKKGFIWKIEGTSLHSTKDNASTLEVNAGVQRINYTYDIEEIDVLTLNEVKSYMSKIKDDLESNGKNTHMLASKVLKSINDKLREIDRLSNANMSENEDEFKENKEKFTKAKQSLNALKNIEIGYWQYKNHTTIKIKEYCDASIKARRKDYADFNTV